MEDQLNEKKTGSPSPEEGDTRLLCAPVLLSRILFLCLAEPWNDTAWNGPIDSQAASWLTCHLKMCESDVAHELVDVCLQGEREVKLSVGPLSVCVTKTGKIIIWTD